MAFCSAWRVLLCIYISVILVGLFLIWYVGWDKIASTIFDTTDDTHSVFLSGLLLSGCFIFISVFWLPSPLFIMLLIGFFCGFWYGCAFGIFAESTGFLISVLLARSCGCVRDLLEGQKQLQLAATILAEEDLKFLVLWRFMWMPLPIKNYAMAFVERPIWRIMLLSLPGIAYWVSIIVYIGSKAHQVIDKVRKGETNQIVSLFSGWEVVFVVISVSAFLAIAYLGYTEYRRRSRALEDVEEPLVRRHDPAERAA